MHWDVDAKSIRFETYITQAKSFVQGAVIRTPHASPTCLRLSQAGTFIWRRAYDRKQTVDRSMHAHPPLTELVLVHAMTRLQGPLVAALDGVRTAEGITRGTCSSFIAMAASERRRRRPSRPLTPCSPPALLGCSVLGLCSGAWGASAFQPPPLPPLAPFLQQPPPQQQQPQVRMTVDIPPHPGNPRTMNGS